ncbi:MAG: polysaccharide deacetylase family protein [Planctomycetota bacterium]
MVRGAHHPAALTVDLEDIAHAELVRRRAPGAAAGSRIARSTARLLDLFDRKGVRATFFVVGELLRKEPETIRRIARLDHEIGCHSYSHRPLWELSPEEFRAELREFQAALAEVVPGARAAGFRAPTFSVDRRTAWALGVLEEEGFAYDSSVVPARGPLYGCPGAPLSIYRPSREDICRHDPGGRLVEFPAPVADLGIAKVPVGGGIYLRLLPFRVYRRLFERVLARRPGFVYVHPWETDPETPRVPLPLAARCATYSGLRGMLGKLERLVDAVRFTTMAGAISQSLERETPWTSKSASSSS